MIAISKYNKQHPLRVFEAFAGYGSQSLAFKYLKDKHPEFDFKVVGYSEIEPSAIQAYGLLHGRDIPNFGDVTRIDWNEVPDFDFISWSSPCQDFSNAGLRKGAEEGSGTRSSLIFQEKRMLAVKKPKYVMLENVKGLLTEKMRKYFFQYLKDLDSFGYTSFYKVLDAKIMVCLNIVNVSSLSPSSELRTSRTQSITSLLLSSWRQRLRTSWKMVYLPNISYPSPFSKSISPKQTSMNQSKTLPRR